VPGGNRRGRLCWRTRCREALGPRAGEADGGGQGQPLGKLCQSHGVPAERANAVLREERRRWDAAQPPNKAPHPAEVASNSLGMRFAWCPPGSFLMGSPPDEEERARRRGRCTR